MQNKLQSIKRYIIGRALENLFFGDKVVVYDKYLRNRYRCGLGLITKAYAELLEENEVLFIANVQDTPGDAPPKIISRTLFIAGNLNNKNDDSQ